jgi:hypothetical protein
MKGVVKHVQNSILFPKKGKVKGSIKNKWEVYLILLARSEKFGLREVRCRKTPMREFTLSGTRVIPSAIDVLVP